MNKTLFKISEVAKLSNVSRQTLIFYDKKNILKPAFVDENKYRYYAINQIHQIQIINMLKELGLPLKTIGQYIDNKDKEELSLLLGELKTQMQENIDRSLNYIDAIEYEQSLIQSGIMVSDYNEILIKEKEAFFVFRGEKFDVDEQDGDGHFKKAREFEKSVKEHSIVGMGIDVIVEEKYLNEDYNNQLSYLCIKQSKRRKDLNLVQIPSGLYVTGYHKGTNQSSLETYRKIIKFIKDNHLAIDGFAYETSINNFLTEKSSDDFLSEISIKVKRK